MCGRCGGEQEYTGHWGRVDYWECEICGHVATEEDFEWEYGETARLLDNTRRPIIRLSAKAHFTKTGGVRKLSWQMTRRTKIRDRD